MSTQDRLKHLQIKTTNSRKFLDQERGKQALLVDQIGQLKKDIIQIDIDLDTYAKCMVLLQKVSDYARTQMKVQMEDIVTTALKTVFGRDMKFAIGLDVLRGQPSATFSVESDGIANNPEDARGGGLVDVISIALRCASLIMYDPPLTHVLVLDEPGKMISEQYASGLAYFLKEFSNQTGTQIIMITHNDALAAVADKAFAVSQKDGVSSVNEVGSFELARVLDKNKGGK